MNARLVIQLFGTAAVGRTFVPLKTCPHGIPDKAVLRIVKIEPEPEHPEIVASAEYLEDGLLVSVFEDEIITFVDKHARGWCS